VQVKTGAGRQALQCARTALYIARGSCFPVCVKTLRASSE